MMAAIVLPNNVHQAFNLGSKSRALAPEPGQPKRRSRLGLRAGSSVGGRGQLLSPPAWLGRLGLFPVALVLPQHQDAGLSTAFLWRRQKQGGSVGP